MDVGPALFGLRLLVVSVCAISVLAGQVAGQGKAQTPASSGRSVQKQASELKKLQLSVGKLVVRKFPNNFLAHQVLANVYKTQGDQENLLKALTKCATVAPERADIHEQLGIQSQEIDDYSAAAEHYRKSLAITKSEQVSIRLAEVLMELGDVKEASALLEDAKPDAEGKVPYLLGEIAFQRADLELAKKYFFQAIEQTPNQMNALYGMVKISTQLDELDKAEKYSKEFERVQEQVAELNQQRRRSYDDIKLLKRKTATTLVEAGRAYHLEKQIPGAMKLWTEAASLDASNEASRMLLAAQYSAGKQLKLALPSLRELVTINPTNPLHYEKLGLTLAASGDLSGAEKTFVAMTKVPKPARGLRMLAKFYLNTNRKLATALTLATQSVEREPNADSHFVHGWALAKNKKFAAARTALRRAIELDKSNRLYQQLYKSLPTGN